MYLCLPFGPSLNNSRNLNLATYYVFGWDELFYVKTSTTFSVRLEVNFRVSRTQNMKSEKKDVSKESYVEERSTHTVLYTF